MEDLNCYKNNFNYEEVKSMSKTIFTDYDKDRDNIMSHYEIANLIKEAYTGISPNYKPTHEDILSFIKTHDHDGDGNITLSDLETSIGSILTNFKKSYSNYESIITNNKSITTSKEPKITVTTDDNEYILIKQLNDLKSKLIDIYGESKIQSEIDNAINLFNIFDIDNDNLLSKTEINNLSYKLLEDNKINNINVSVSDIILKINKNNKDFIALNEFLIYKLELLL